METETKVIRPEPPFAKGYEESIQELEKLRGIAKPSGVEKQKMFILERYLLPMGCPLCLHRFGAMDSEVTCPNCEIKVRRVVPFVMQPGTPGWHWSLSKPSRDALLRLWKQERRKP